MIKCLTLLVTLIVVTIRLKYNYSFNLRTQFR